MRVAIDASRTTVARVTGTERYALELIRALIVANEQQAHPHQLDLYFRDAPAPDLLPVSSWVRQHVIPFRRAWTHLRWAWEIWRTRPDLSFVPAHSLPVLLRGAGMVTIHDVGYLYFPQAHPRFQRWYLDWTTRYSAWRAQTILADSQATADDLERWYGVKADKIQVVYPGVHAPAEGRSHALVQAKFNLPEAYFVFIGTLQPRKNIARLVQAYAQWRAQSGRTIGLVLAGGRGWLYEPAWTAHIEGVQELGYIDEQDKRALLEQSLGLVFPSLYEGFGFPVLEAMHCGTPVLASNTSSLPELVGSAGVLVNPLDVQDIVQGLERLASADARQRAEWAKAGRAQAQAFTWQAAARQVLAVWNDPV